MDAADFSATSLEIFDDNAGQIDWRMIYLGSFAGSPVGCDSNGTENGLDGTKKSVDAADLTCTVRLFFGEACESLEGAASEMPNASASLTVGDGLHVAGGTVAVPVVLNTAGQNVAAAAFVLEFDPALFSVDATDADGDGIADAIRLSVPDSVAKIVMVDDEAGEIKIALFGTSLPLPLIPDGLVANITLTGKATVAGQSAVNLAQVSMGNDQGRSIEPVLSNGGFISFLSGDSNSVFLPLMQNR